MFNDRIYIISSQCHLLSMIAKHYFRNICGSFFNKHFNDNEAGQMTWELTNDRLGGRQYRFPENMGSLNRHLWSFVSIFRFTYNIEFFNSWWTVDGENFATFEIISQQIMLDHPELTRIIRANWVNIMTYYTHKVNQASAMNAYSLSNLCQYHTFLSPGK